MTKKAPPAADFVPVPTRVEIAAGGHQVVIESTDPLSTVARKAVELWRATDSPAVTRGVSTTVGFSADLPNDGVPPELTLPDRLLPGSEDERRQTLAR